MPTGLGLAVNSVYVEPANSTLLVAPGENILEAALRAGWKWPTICHGDGTCTACWIEILEGEDNVGSIDETEARGLESLRMKRLLKGPARLACQLVPTGAVRVRKNGAAPPTSSDMSQALSDS